MISYTQASLFERERETERGEERERRG